MHRFDFFYRQFVTEAEMDAAFDAVEEAIGHFVGDFGFQGVCYGADVAQNSPPDWEVVVGGPAIVYDQLQQRIAWAADQNVDVTLDENGAATVVTTVGNERWLSIFAKFARVESNERVDGLGNIIKYDRAESFQLKVAMTEYEYPLGTGTKPSLRMDEILIADVRRTYGDTQILDAEIDHSRTQLPFDLSGSPLSIKQKDLQSVLQDMVDEINTFNSSVSDLEDDVNEWVNERADLCAGGGTLWVQSGYSGATESGSPSTPFSTLVEATDWLVANAASGSSWVIMLGPGSSYAPPATWPDNCKITLAGPPYGGATVTGSTTWTPTANGNSLKLRHVAFGGLTVEGSVAYSLFLYDSTSTGLTTNNSNASQTLTMGGDHNVIGGSGAGVSSIGGTGDANLGIKMRNARIGNTFECDYIEAHDSYIAGHMTIHSASFLIDCVCANPMNVTGSGGTIGLSVDAFTNYYLNTLTSITKTLIHDES